MILVNCNTIGERILKIINESLETGIFQKWEWEDVNDNTYGEGIENK